MLVDEILVVFCCLRFFVLSAGSPTPPTSRAVLVETLRLRSLFKGLKLASLG